MFFPGPMLYDTGRAKGEKNGSNPKDQVQRSYSLNRVKWGWEKVDANR